MNTTKSNNRNIWFDNFETKPIFTTASDTTSTTTTDSVAQSETGMTTPVEEFTPTAAYPRGANLHHSYLGPQEPRAADTAPTSTETDEVVMMNLRLNESGLLFDDVDQSSSNYFMGNHRPESSGSPNIMWDGENMSSASSAKNGDVLDTFDFLIKCLASANNFVSMLTREQLAVLRAMRPGLLYEFLQEVARVRGDKRMRRALPNECAFCKNNGENEECYSSHALKDWSGRVLCPVLRAFRCPRCSATGDRAHTIKYCPESPGAGSDRGESLAARRRLKASLVAAGATRVPAASPAPMSHSSLSHVSLSQASLSQTSLSQASLSQAALAHSSVWANFGIN